MILFYFSVVRVRCDGTQVLGEQLKAQTQMAAQARAQLRDVDSNPSSSGATGFLSGDTGLKAEVDQKQAALRSLQEERDRLEGELSEALEKVSPARSKKDCFCPEGARLL